MRKVYSLWIIIPTHLIFLPPKELGMGYDRLTDSSQLIKRGALKRAATLGGHPAQASHALLT